MNNKKYNNWPFKIKSTNDTGFFVLKDIAGKWKQPEHCRMVSFVMKLTEAE